MGEEVSVGRGVVVVVEDCNSSWRVVINPVQLAVDDSLHGASRLVRTT